MADQHQPPAQAAGRGLDPAAQGIPEQGAGAGRAGQPDAHRQAGKRLSQRQQPAQDGLGVEAELGHHRHLQPGAAGGEDLGGKVLLQLVHPDAGMPARVAGDVHRLDARPGQQSRVDQLQAVAERAQRPLPVPGDHQHPAHAGVRAQLRQEAAQRLAAGVVAHRQVRHRLEAGAAHQRRLLHQPPGGNVGQGAQVDPGARGQVAPQGLQLGGLGHGGLDGKPAHQPGDALLQGRSVRRGRLRRGHEIAGRHHGGEREREKGRRASGAPAGDDEGLVVEPQPSVLV